MTDQSLETLIKHLITYDMDKTRESLNIFAATVDDKAIELIESLKKQIDNPSDDYLFTKVTMANTLEELSTAAENYVNTCRTLITALCGNINKIVQK